MKKAAKKVPKKVDWHAIDQQVFQLRFAKLSPEEKLKEVRRLADLYVQGGKPIPAYLAALL